MIINLNDIGISISQIICVLCIIIMTIEPFRIVIYYLTHDLDSEKTASVAFNMIGAVILPIINIILSCIGIIVSFAELFANGNILIGIILVSVMSIIMYIFSWYIETDNAFAGFMLYCGIVSGVNIAIIICVLSGVARLI